VAAHSHSLGFIFPLPEGLTLSKAHLLVAQAFIPPTEQVEAAGFVFPGDNFDLRAEVIRRINDVPEYRRLFGRIFPDVRSGGPITYDMFAQAIAEFEFTLVFANAPLDRFARGQRNALTDDQKRGALLFFGSANCVTCHAVSGQSNEMFSDFREHVVGVPQIAPAAGNPAAGNVTFDGPGQNEDFGLEQVTLNPNDRYSSEPRQSETYPCSPRFSTTVPSPDSKTHFGSTSTRPGGHPATTRRRLASQAICAAPQDHLNRCWHVLIRYC